ncbi:MAG: APC family permease [Candidatus Velthaea sp.]
MRRVLTLGDLLLIAAAAIGPAFSLATTFGPMVAAGGSATPLALAAVTLIMACVAIAYRRLGERYPTAGSSYAWVRTAFGTRTGAYAAWVLIVANIFAVVATAVPAGTYTLALFAPQFAASSVAAGCIGAVWVLAAGALLYAGLRPTAVLANVLIVAELVVLVLGAGIAFTHPALHDAARSAAPPAWSGLIGAIVIGIWMTDGWEVSASTAEEAHAAERAPGLGGLTGLLLTAAVLGISTIAFMRVGSLEGFNTHEGDAMAYVGAQLGGEGWRVAVTVTVLISLAASLQTTLVYLTRSFFAMGRDGVLPEVLGRVDRRAQPAGAIVLMTGIGVACTLASALSPSLKSAFTFILSGTSVFLGILFMLSAAAAVRIFGGEPARRLTGVVIPALGTIALALVLGCSFVQSDSGTQLFIVGAALAGVPLAFWRAHVAQRARFPAST